MSYLFLFSTEVYVVESEHLLQILKDFQLSEYLDDLFLCLLYTQFLQTHFHIVFLFYLFVHTSTQETCDLAEIGLLLWLNVLTPFEFLSNFQFNLVEFLGAIPFGSQQLLVLRSYGR